MELKPGESVTIACSPCPQTGGPPLATEFRLPMLNAGISAWYEATTVYGPYDVHPKFAEDWNLESGGNTDLGEPVVAPFSGIILSANDWGGGIGGVVQIFGITLTGEMIVWCGWHLLDIQVKQGQIVTVGEQAAAIGNCNGKYSAHLHEQICIVGKHGIPSATVYPSDNRFGWVRPSDFHKTHGVDPDLVERCRLKDGK